MSFPIYTSKDNAWREYVNPLRGLTMDSLVAKIEQGERGAFADLQWFYQAMERSDALIATVAMRRRAALLSMNWDAVPEASPSDATLAREQAAYLHDLYDGIENLREVIAYLATAAFRGFAHAEKHWSEDGSSVLRLEPVEQWFWCRDGMFGEWTYNRDAKSGAERGEEIERGNFVICESPIALDRILSVQYFRRNLAMRDWSSFLDVYGIPSVFFVGKEGFSQEKEDALFDIAQKLVRDGRGYLPHGTDVKYVDGGNGRNRPPFRDHLDYLDKQITLLGTGGLLTMMAESGSGTLAGSAHQQAFDQVARSDAVMVSEALQRDFDLPMLERAFPGWPVEAYFTMTGQAPSRLPQAQPAVPDFVAQAGGVPPGAAAEGVPV